VLVYSVSIAIKWSKTHGNGLIPKIGNGIYDFIHKWCKKYILSIWKYLSVNKGNSQLCIFKNTISMNYNVIFMKKKKIKL